MLIQTIFKNLRVSWVVRSPGLGVFFIGRSTESCFDTVSEALPDTLFEEVEQRIDIVANDWIAAVVTKFFAKEAQNSISLAHQVAVLLPQRQCTHWCMRFHISPLLGAYPIVFVLVIRKEAQGANSLRPPSQVIEICQLAWHFCFRL